MSTTNGVILSEQHESKGLRTDSTANLNEMRRFFDSANTPLRMTYLLRCAFSLHAYKIR